MKTVAVLSMFFLMMLAWTGIAFAYEQNYISENRQIVAVGPDALITVLSPQIAPLNKAICEKLTQMVFCQSIQMSDCTGHDTGDENLVIGKIAYKTSDILVAADFTGHAFEAGWEVLDKTFK